MSHPRGYNPIKYDCAQAGCYLTQCHPTSEWFASCFPGKISFSDMDRIVERNGRALVLEWKGQGGRIALAQEIMWRKLSRGCVVTVIAVNGDARTMEVRAYRLCWNGVWREWQAAGMIDLAEKIKAWARWAESNPVFSVAINRR